MLKNIKKQDDVSVKRQLTANEFINIKDIKDNFLYTKDNHIMCYIKIQPINLQLLSKQERIQKTKLYTAEFSSEQKNFKFYSMSRPVDISSLLDNLNEMLSITKNQVQKDLIKKNISETTKLALTGETVERQSFMVLWEEYKDYAEKELLKRARDIIVKFETCGNRAELLEEQYIIQLCNSFTNPNYAFKEDTDITPTIPILNT